MSQSYAFQYLFPGCSDFRTSPQFSEFSRNGHRPLTEQPQCRASLSAFRDAGRSAGANLDNQDQQQRKRKKYGRLAYTGGSAVQDQCGRVQIRSIPPHAHEANQLPCD